MYLNIQTKGKKEKERKKNPRSTLRLIGCTEAIIKGKFMEINACLRKEERLPVNKQNCTSRNQKIKDKSPRDSRKQVIKISIEKKNEIEIRISGSQPMNLIMPTLSQKVHSLPHSKGGSTGSSKLSFTDCILKLEDNVWIFETQQKRQLHATRYFAHAWSEHDLFSNQYANL